MNFLQVIKNSFIKYLETTANSPDKLKPLHGKIAQDVKDKLGVQYKVFSLGFEEGKEKNIQGRYIDKKVDIVIEKNNKVVAGIAVKFVMSNYSQNSNNYFENMLGETANIRACKIPYFQVFIVLEKLPYYKDGGTIKKWENVSDHCINKYITLSEDDCNNFYHTPDKSLFCLLNIFPNNEDINTRNEYKNYYLNNEFEIRYSTKQYTNFDKNIIYNDYDEFINKICYRILSE